MNCDTVENGLFQRVCRSGCRREGSTPTVLSSSESFSGSYQSFRNSLGRRGSVSAAFALRGDFQTVWGAGGSGSDEWERWKSACKHPAMHHPTLLGYRQLPGYGG